jgi:hypothetical protein
MLPSGRWECKANDNNNAVEEGGKPGGECM